MLIFTCSLGPLNFKIFVWTKGFEREGGLRWSPYDLVYEQSKGYQKRCPVISGAYQERVQGVSGEFNGVSRSSQGVSGGSMGPRACFRESQEHFKSLRGFQGWTIGSQGCFRRFQGFTEYRESHGWASLSRISINLKGVSDVSDSFQRFFVRPRRFQGPQERFRGSLGCIREVPEGGTY